MKTLKKILLFSAIAYVTFTVCFAVSAGPIAPQVMVPRSAAGTFPLDNFNEVQAALETLRRREAILVFVVFFVVAAVTIRFIDRPRTAITGLLNPIVPVVSYFTFVITPLGDIGDPHFRQPFAFIAFLCACGATVLALVLNRVIPRHDSLRSSPFNEISELGKQ